MTCRGSVRRRPRTLSPPDVIARIVSPPCGRSAAKSQAGSSHDCVNINRPPYGMGGESPSGAREVCIVTLRLGRTDHSVAAVGTAVQGRTVGGTGVLGELAKQRIAGV